MLFKLIFPTSYPLLTMLTAVLLGFSYSIDTLKIFGTKVGIWGDWFSELWRSRDSSKVLSASCWWSFWYSRLYLRANEKGWFCLLLLLPLTMHYIIGSSWEDALICYSLQMPPAWHLQSWYFRHTVSQMSFSANHSYIFQALWLILRSFHSLILDQLQAVFLTVLSLLVLEFSLEGGFGNFSEYHL